MRSRSRASYSKTARYAYYPSGQLQKITTLNNAPGRNALLVVANKNSLTAGDAALRERLRDVLGLTLTLASDEEAENSTGQELVVIAESVSSGTIGAKYKTAAVPLVHLEENAWNDISLSGSAALAGAGTTLDVLSANQ